MTLVIARRDGDAIIAVADTKLSPELDAPWTPTSQANKFVCLDQNWLLAYAGNTYLADQVLRAKLAPPLQFDILRKHLLEANATSIVNGSEVEFLLFNLITLQMYKFSRGRFTRVEGNTTWLGSKNAFEKYQELNDLASKNAT